MHAMLHGLSVWCREIARPKNGQAPGIIRHESERARRMVGVWEREINHPLMRDGLHIIHRTPGCGPDLEARNPDFPWRPERPNLCAWFDLVSARPSFTATAPPPA